ncbi:hypothetical protein AYO43_07850 [Nitrospira sp. SCGC AG-212-E16]|nr:hypothetical protein AYO43_07850 [Nitrospira sp. SCGC AG-212-E16]
MTSQPRAGNIFPDLFALKLAVDTEVALITMRWAVRVCVPGEDQLHNAPELMWGWHGVCSRLSEKNLKTRLLTLFMMAEL